MPLLSDYSELSDDGALSRRISAIWLFSTSSSGDHWVLPDGCIDLLVKFTLTRDGLISKRHMLITGPSDRPERVPLLAGDHFVGLRFRAGWGGQCLNIDARAMRNSQLEGDQVATALGECAESLFAVNTRSALISSMSIVARTLAERAASLPTSVIQAIDDLHLSGGRLSPPELARTTGTPERTLRRLAGDAIGLSLKTLGAVLRFQRTARLLSVDGSLDLAAAALEGGYGDQSHMTREFRRFGGFTPGRQPPLVFGTLPLPSVAETGKTPTLSTPTMQRRP